MGRLTLEIDLAQKDIESKFGFFGMKSVTKEVIECGTDREHGTVY